MDNNYSDLYDKYKRLKNEFSTYQNFAEAQIQRMNGKNTELEKKLDILTNVIEVSNYINSNISDDNLIPMINDMIIGILGATYSTIYLLGENGELIVKASNVMDNYDIIQNEVFSTFSNKKPVIINSKKPMFEEFEKKLKVHSIIGVPITLSDKFKGYIIVEHTLYDFFVNGHIKFISAIANQIAIAIENNVLYKKVKESSIKDPLLVGIYNRKHFFDIIEDKVKKNPNKSFAMVMVDIDYFKNFNDSYGHQFGDKVLIETARVLAQNIDGKDEIARYGGEEIVIYLDDVENHNEVFDIVDEIRYKLSNNSVNYGGIEKKVTASFGISYYPKDGDTVQKVLSVADAMLYEAKNSGRNKVVSSI